MGVRTMTQETFNQIKELRNLGLGYEKIQEITHRGTGTIRNTIISDTLEEYFIRTREQGRKQKENGTKQHTLTKEEVINANNANSKLVFEVLTVMQADLKKIKEDLARVPKRRVF
jgi:hypothetical protein